MATGFLVTAVRMEAGAMCGYVRGVRAASSLAL